jgi:serine protease Do
MRKRLLRLAMLGAAFLALVAVRADDDLDELQEKAVKSAVKTVAPCVVKIETSGGTEVVKSGPRGAIRRGIGPTTGLIVRADGYVISSAFNFANKPSTIRVAIPGFKERKVAHVVANDTTRMLTLLKIVDLPAGTKLPVPTPAPKADIAIGNTAVAVGRTLTPDADGMPSVSVGIISALDRIWGKAIQTDAKVSPVNYGGPLVDLEGRVQGVLVPASPQAEGETAGFEWYDSGIGFAIPLTDINAVLPRMLKGTEKEPVTLRRGYMGVTMRSPDLYEAAPVIATVAPGSAGEKAGLKSGDLIKAIGGKKINSYAQLLHQIGARYEGDPVSITIERDKKEITFDKVVLGSPEAAFPQAFLGILPVRDDPDPGVAIRYVYPKSPAEAAKLQEGDRIMKIASPIAPPTAPLLAITGGRNQLMNAMQLARPGQSLKLEVKRKGGKTETLTVKLAELPNVVPAKLNPDNGSAKKALIKPGAKPTAKAPAAKKPDTGFLKKQTPAADHTYWIYVPDNYDPNIAYAVVIWLHPLGKNKERDIEDFASPWQEFCDDNNIILVCPQSDNMRGWTPGESDFVQQAVRSVASTYTVDTRRVIAHGMGVGGEMAFYLGFQARALIHGVATVGAHMASNPREKVANQPLSFFLAVGSKDPLAKAVVQTREKLIRFKYPVILREVENLGHEYLDSRKGKDTLDELVRWIDSLDRI